MTIATNRCLSQPRACNTKPAQAVLFGFLIYPVGNLFFGSFSFPVDAYLTWILLQNGSKQDEQQGQEEAGTDIYDTRPGFEKAPIAT